MNIKSNTWLPVFPGFYETIFEPHDDVINEDIEDQVHDAELKQVMFEKLYMSTEYSEAVKDYQNQVVKECVSFMNGELSEFVEDITLEGLVSPREYNFYNDSINVEIVFSEKNIRNIKKFISDNAGAWREYLKERYTSYSGFMSSHDNFPESCEWQVEAALNDRHNAGAILQFICSVKEINIDALYD